MRVDIDIFEKYLTEGINDFNIEDDDNFNEKIPEKNYDPLSLVERAIESDLDNSVFDSINDSDLPLAPNWLEFCIGKSFLNFPPFPMQLKFGLEFFADYCPDCSDKRIMKKILVDHSIQDILDKVQLLQYGTCPKCKKTRADFVKEGKLQYYNELAGCAGQRSGKSVWVAMTANYQLHRYLKLPNPSHYFGLAKKQPLHMVFVAITYKQASDTLWDPFCSYYEASPWFKEYNELLDYHSEKIGKPLYSKKTTFLLYNHKKLMIYASGPDKRKLRGRTGFFASIDELGWFHGTEKAVKLNADEICDALENSLQTIRSSTELKRTKFNQFNSPDALFVNISSPTAANDKIMRLVRSKIPNRYSFHLSTWEMNPNVTRKHLDSKFIEDPIAAERDFGANPPLSDSPYISNSEIIKNIININYRNKCTYNTTYNLDTLGHSTIKVKKFIIKDLDKTINHVLGIDTGHSKNSFAVVLQHYEYEKKCAVLDLAVEVKPQEGSTVHFPSMYNLVIEPIIKRTTVSLVVFDKWQSINYEDELHDEKIESVRYSLKHEDFSNIRGYILSSKVIFPKPEISFDKIINPTQSYPTFLEKKPIAHLIYQTLTVRDIGRTITKGLGVDDDIFRAWCLGIKYIFDPKWEKIFKVPSFKMRTKKGLGTIIGRTASNNSFLEYNIKNNLGCVNRKSYMKYI